MVLDWIGLDSVSWKRLDWIGWEWIHRVVNRIGLD